MSMYRVYPPYDACYYIGVDLGQTNDSTAIAVVEEPVYIPPQADRELGLLYGTGWHAPDALVPGMLDQAWRAMLRYGRPHAPLLSVRHLERLPLGTNYVDVVARIKTLLATPPLADRRTCLLVDITGVGRGVYDLMRREGLEAIGISIHGGSDISGTAEGFSVPKRDLIAASQVRLQSRTLLVAAGLAEADTLVKELQNYRVKIDERTSHDSYNARTGQHDDLVLALSIAVWFRGFFLKHQDSSLDGQMAAIERLSNGRKTKRN